jgi:hypothetical protein
MRIAIEDRRATDDVPTEPPAPVVEADERRRDAEVAGHVGRNVLGLSIAYAAGLAIIGGLVAWGLTGLGSRWFWVALAVGAVTGAVLGGIQGGIGAAMSESEKEEGSLLIVSLQDASAAKQAERTIREHDPARVDVQHGGRLAG